MAIDILTGLGLGTSIAGSTYEGVSAYQQAKGAISDDEKKRLRELERLEAINMLGGDYNIALGKQMTPVQGAMREAKERMSQDVSAQDISSGSYFRGQQAMETAAGKERSAAAQRAQVDMAQQEAMNKQELESLRKLQKIQDDALMYGLKSAAGSLTGLGSGLTQIGIAREEQEALKRAAKERDKALKRSGYSTNMTNEQREYIRSVLLNNLPD